MKSFFLNKFKNKFKLLFIILFIILIISGIFTGIFLSIKSNSNNTHSTTDKKLNSTLNSNNLILKENENTFLNSENTKQNNINIITHGNNFKEDLIDLKGQRINKKYFNSDEEKTMIFKIMFDILKNQKVEDYSNLENLFGWFKTQKIELNDKFKFNFEINNFTNNNPKLIKWLITSLFIIINKFIKDSIDADTLQNELRFKFDDIEKLKSNAENFVIEPLNNVFTNIKFIYKSNENEDGNCNDGSTKKPIFGENPLIPKEVTIPIIGTYPTRQSDICIPTIGIEMREKIGYSNILKFIYRLIKYLIFKITPNPELNKNIDFKNVVNLINNYYKNNKENAINFYKFIIKAILKNFRINFQIDNETLNESKLLDFVIRIIIKLHGIKISGFLQSVISYITNTFLSDEFITSEIMKAIKLDYSVEENGITVDKGINVRNKGFYYIEKFIFFTEIIHILGLKNIIEYKTLTLKYGDLNVSLIEKIKWFYDEMVKTINTWLDYELIDNKKIDFIKELLSELNIEEFFSSLEKPQNKEFEWNKIITKNAELLRYSSDEKIENKKLLLIQYKNKIENQKYSIIIERISNKNYKLIYFATNHYQDLIDLFIKSL